MYKFICLSLFALVQGSLGHGSHDNSGPAQGETIQEYAQRHMSSEHHIDSFDVRSFFQLHDLNRNGIWDKDEIEAIYGVHHVYSQKKSKDEVEHQNKADQIVRGVLERLDLNNDGQITPEELERVGLAGLPNFDGLGAEGHHYDIESGTPNTLLSALRVLIISFHNSCRILPPSRRTISLNPETQTDESYNHPEDLEHFAQHEAIERKEAEREAAFEGVPVEEVLKSLEKAAAAEAAGQNPDGSPKAPTSKPVTRIPPPEKQDPSVKFKDAQTEGAQKGEWGTGTGGYKPPTDPSDKMRKNLPYKYKFRRNWGDF